MGRAFAANDFAGNGRSVVIGDSLWERQFARHGIRAVSGEAMAVTRAGFAIGFAVLPSTLSAIARFAGGLPTSPGPLVVAAARVFASAATASAYGPARRASRANAADVLRAD